ncbi:MAG: hypothetical protein IT379_42110 [Deltaproteobacteria bacterium]|nr:hypothetical protein [Deltaproteobacteria bacterium]
MTPDARHAREQLEAAIHKMVASYPFHAHLVSAARLEEDPRVATMAVTVRGGSIVFLYDAAFVLSCTPQQRIGTLVHETLHILFAHPHVDRSRYRDTVARLLAEEVTVNEHVHEPLPGSPIRLEMFPELPPGEDTETRYLRLASRRSARGNHSREARRQELAARSLDDHTIWSEVASAGAWTELVTRAAVEEALDQTTPDERARMEPAIRAAIEAVARGESPGRAIARVQRLSEHAPDIDWRLLLRAYVRDHTGRRRVLHRPPRRMPELVGVVAGTVAHPGRPRVVAAIDTSGSIDDAALGAICSELAHLARDHEVFVLEADAAVHSAYRYTGPITSLTGRGGTDLRPVFSSPHLRGADVAVYFTDGEGPAPERAPALPVVWCLVPRGRAPARWGRVVRMR